MVDTLCSILDGDKCYGKEKPDREHRDCGGGLVTVLVRMVRTGLIGKTLFEQRYKARERGNAGEGRASVRTLSTGWV